MTESSLSRRRALGLIALGTVGVAAATTGWVSGLGAPVSGRLQAGTEDQLLAQPALWPAGPVGWMWS